MILSVELESVCGVLSRVVFFYKQKTAYEMRISDWSSDVCSSDLGMAGVVVASADAQAQQQSKQNDFRIRAPQLSQSSGTEKPSGQMKKSQSRSEERRVGKESVSTCRYRWSPTP